jgi:tRNA 2-thiouridine synthesizing protein E
VPLTPERWKLIDVARAEFDEKKVAANIRRLTQISGLSTKDIFTLFPKAPGRTIARIAGTPKPAGCI